eukprot:gnl/Chilomastix_cuspidata/5064.p1 GENE.gnl/Chilomastix_cuspidata/5064~~gnl/Chilomastix_cuspidata/5064.p1  ORF type:complete len:939 (-),score=356.72 gnl/Chilomastix_cuspidata/5064:161-2977(-)
MIGAHQSHDARYEEAMSSLRGARRASTSRAGNSGSLSTNFVRLDMKHNSYGTFSRFNTKGKRKKTNFRRKYQRETGPHRWTADSCSVYTLDTDVCFSGQNSIAPGLSDEDFQQIVVIDGSSESGASSDACEGSSSDEYLAPPSPKRAAAPLARAADRAGDPLERLRDLFRLGKFRGHQQSVIDAVVRRKSVLLVAPTGSGKSLCYQLPGAMMSGEGFTLVVSPLIALMDDQIAKLNALDRPELRAVALHTHGGASSRWRRRRPALAVDPETVPAEIAAEPWARDTGLVWTMRELATRKATFLFVSPERIASSNFRRALRFVAAHAFPGFAAPRRCALVALDEAHCLSEWSHNFRTTYLRFSALLETDAALAGAPLVALTATTQCKALPSVCRALRIPISPSFFGAGAAAPTTASRLFSSPTSLVVHDTSVPPNITFRFEEKINRNEVFVAHLAAKFAAFMRARDGAGGGGRQFFPFPAIAYVRRRAEVEIICRMLNARGVPARPFHGRMPQKTRTEVLREFQTGEQAVVVATVAFGMGIDKANVRAVFHLFLPPSPEEMLQRAGRAGRDGKPALFFCLFEPADFLRLKTLTAAETASPELTQALCEALRPARTEREVLLDLAKLGRRFNTTDALLLTLVEYANLRSPGAVRVAGETPLAIKVTFHGAAFDEARDMALATWEGKELGDDVTATRVWGLGPDELSALGAVLALASERNGVYSLQTKLLVCAEGTSVRRVFSVLRKLAAARHLNFSGTRSGCLVVVAPSVAPQSMEPDALRAVLNRLSTIRYTTSVRKLRKSWLIATAETKEKRKGLIRRYFEKPPTDGLEGAVVPQSLPWRLAKPLAGVPRHVSEVSESAKAMLTAVTERAANDLRGMVPGAKGGGQVLPFLIASVVCGLPCPSLPNPRVLDSYAKGLLEDFAFVYEAAAKATAHRVPHE